MIQLPERISKSSTRKSTGNYLKIKIKKSWRIMDRKNDNKGDYLTLKTKKSIKPYSSPKLMPEEEAAKFLMVR